MIFEEVQDLLPKDWFPMDIFNKKYEIFPLSPFSNEYTKIVQQIMIGNYYLDIEGIYKVQNPFLYAKYNLRKHEYESRGPFSVLNLFHDTDRSNVDSIACFNLDWRLGKRFKYGPGVYFSSAPALANKHSCKENGLFRSMFIFEVLIQNVQIAETNIFLPDHGFDTVRSINSATYVKYFDNEFYPDYFVNYVSGSKTFNYI